MADNKSDIIEILKGFFYLIWRGAISGGITSSILIFGLFIIYSLVLGNLSVDLLNYQMWEILLVILIPPFVIGMFIGGISGVIVGMIWGHNGRLSIIVGAIFAPFVQLVILLIFFILLPCAFIGC